MLEAVQPAHSTDQAPPAVVFGGSESAVARLAQLGEQMGETAETVRILVALAEFYDDDTPAHATRVARTAAGIARVLGCEADFVAMIRAAASLHDIGKIGISRRVLLKPGALTPFERENVMRHVEIGARVLGAGRSPALRLAVEVARTHHERWDGDGYMIGLEGREIPLGGRITAVADVFDVLTHVRPYKPAWDVERAVEELRAKAGRQFDPEVVEAFCTLDAEALRDLPEHVAPPPVRSDL